MRLRFVEARAKALTASRFAGLRSGGTDMPEIVTFFSDIVEQAPHLCVFLTLFLCGLGLPIPEEVTLIVAAWATVKGWAPLPSMFLVATLAILAGDLATYAVGRRFGYRFVRLPYFRRVLSEERLRKVDVFFDRYGDWAVFIARFFAGFRLACYFIAGISRLRVHIFVFMDFLAALLSVGLTFFVVRSFGDEIAQAISYLRRAEHILTLIVASAVVVFVAWKLWKPKKERSAPAPPETEESC